MIQLVLIIGPLLSHAQPDTTEVFEFEYFFDVDPGFGSATTIAVATPMIEISTVETLLSSGLSTGFHVLGYRARNLASRPYFGGVNPSSGAPFGFKPSDWVNSTLLANGDWGMTETRLVFVDQSEVASVINVDQIEFFFDNDPGVGLATLSDPFSPNSDVSLTQTLGSTGLAPGFHILGLRARTVGGAWGTTETRLIFVDQSGGSSISNVDQIEYYFDNDPGVGSASSIATFSPGTSVSIVESINSDTLSVGFHILGMRARSEGGAWGSTETRLIFIDQTDAASIVNVEQIEYFFDHDPGVGSASLLTSFSPTNALSIIESLNSDTLSVGFHVVGMRARAEGGAWGTTETRLIFVDPSQNVINVDQVEYFFDVDPGVGSATAITSFSPTSSISLVESLSSNGLTMGFHTLGMRARAEGGAWGTTETRLLFVDQAGSLTDVTEFEYFIGEDPGFGQANAVSFLTPGPTVADVVSLNTDTLSLGSTQRLGIRVRNAQGDWGITESRTIGVTNLNAPVITSNDTITNTTPATLEIAFDEPITDFVVADFIVDNGSVEVASFVDNGDNTFTVDINLDTEGPIFITIPDSAAFAADDNSASPASDFTVFYDVTTPTVTVDALITSDISPTLTGTIDDDSAAVSVTVAGISYDASIVSGGIWTLNTGILDPLSAGVYDVMVTATDQAGNVGNDATTDELTIDVVDFAILQPSEITDTSFVANWIGGVDLVNYQIDVSNSSDFSTFLPGLESFETIQNSVLVTGLDFNTNYYYRARFVNTSSVVSEDSEIISVKTLIDTTTTADSLALVSIFSSVSPVGLNWVSARLRDWDGITLDGSRTRVTGIDISGTSASGDLPNPFSAAILSDNGLSELTDFDGSGNMLTGLLDFSTTSITSVDVSSNSLTFSDLEPLLGTPTFNFMNQSEVSFIVETNPEFIKDTELERLGEVRIAPRGENYTLLTGLAGTNNVYSWTREGVDILTTDVRFTQGGNSLTVNTIDIDNMGLMGGMVTNEDFAGLTLTLVPEYVFAVVDLSMELTDFGGTLLPSTEQFRGALLETEARSSGYDTLSRTAGLVSSVFTFEDVILGDYLCGIDPENREDYVPTYFGDAFTWEEADTIEVRGSTDPIRIAMTDEPDEETGPGSLDVVIEEDFGDDEGSRIDARRRAKKRKCGLRRKRSGGRVEQDDDEFELFAYGETDDNGQFRFGFLPEGTYRFFVEYPGIPLDASSFVEFEVGELGISDTEFSLNAFATEDGVEVTIERVLGLILTYFKDLSVYPNPVEDAIKIRYRHLKSSDVRAELVDLSGQVEWSKDLRTGYDGSLEVDVRELSAGIYILRFYDRKSRNENVVSYRVVVK